MDFLLSYPDENSMNADEEGKYLREKAESADETELVAEVGGDRAAEARFEHLQKLVKMFTDSLSKPIIAKPVNVSTASPELLKEIINGGRK